MAEATEENEGVGMIQDSVVSNDPARLELIDGLRGFALMGLFLVHAVELFELYWVHPVPDPWFDATMAIFAGKAFSLFALCFGLSFSIIMDRTRRRGVDFRGRFAWRLTLLFLIGLAHGLVYRGDILQVLAAAGLVLLLFDRIRDNRILLLLAFLILLQAPLAAQIVAAHEGAAWTSATPLFMTDQSLAAVADGSFAELVRANTVDGMLAKWSFYLSTGRVAQIIGLFLIGLFLGRIGFFERPEAFVKPRRILLAAAAALAVALMLAKPALSAAIAPEGSPAAAGQALDWMVSGWIAIALMAVQLILFVELYQSFAQPVLRLLAPVGRMTLTLYVGQSLVFVPIFYGFGLGWHDDISEAQALGLGVAAFLLQIALARWWFRHFHYGPLEWLWRAATWLRADIPFRRRPTPVPQTV